MCLCVRVYVCVAAISPSAPSNPLRRLVGNARTSPSPSLPGPRDVILERFVRVLYIRLSDVPCRRHIPYLRRIPLRHVDVCVGRNQGQERSDRARMPRATLSSERRRKQHPLNFVV